MVYYQASSSGAGLTGNLPLGAVLAPDANAMVAGRNTDATMKLKDAGPEILGSLVNLGIRLPEKMVIPALGRGVPRSRTQAFIIGKALDAVLPHVVERTNSRIEGL